MWVFELLPYILFLSLVLILSGKNKNMIYVYIIMSCFVGFSYGVGWDYFNYLYRTLTIGVIERQEFFPRIIGLFAININHKQTFFILHAFITTFFFLKSIKKLSLDYRLSILVFTTFPFFYLGLFTIIRFMAAFSIIFYASTFLIKDKNIVMFLLFVFIAFNFHSSAIMGILYLYPFIVKKYSKRYNILILLVSVFFSFTISELIRNYINIIFSNLGGLDDLQHKFDQYSVGKANNSSKIPFIWYSFNLLNIFFREYIYKRDSIVDVYITLFNIGCCLLVIFSNINGSMSSRFSSLFLVQLIILVSYMKKNELMIFSLYAFGIFVFLYSLSMEVHHFDFIGRRNCYLPYDLFFFHQI